MKRLLFSLSMITMSLQILQAQVGIQTTTPNAQLDIRSSNQATPINTDGVLIPKVDVFPATNPTALQQGMLVYLTTATTFSGNPKVIGFYYWDNTTTDWIGITSAASGDADWYKVGTTIPPNLITDNMFHTGNVAIGKNTAVYPLEINTTNLNIGVNNTFTSSLSNGVNKIGLSNNLTGTSNDASYGFYNTINSSGTGNHFGNYTSISSSGNGVHSASEIDLSGTGNGGQYGVSTTISNSGNGTHYGTVNRLTTTGSGDQYGSYNILGGTGTGTQYGNYLSINNSGANTQYGSYSILSGNGFGGHTGNYNLLSGSSGGVQAGTYNEITNTAGSTHYGAVSNLSGTGAATKYGFYATINPVAGGTHYGIYSEVLKAGTTNFAGYFLGNVAIGTTIANTYTLPASRGTNLQIMQTDGVGNVTWQNPNTALNSFAWTTSGNSGTNGGNITTAGTNFLGTTDNQNIDIRTNNIYRARFSSLGEFFVGTLNTTITGDLSNAVSNATFPWALNGYSDYNGSGTYGRIMSGTTIYGGVQGETSSTNAQATGVRGIDLVGTAGTSLTLPRSGVNGDVANAAGTYKFGVYGTGGLTTRTGGVMGNDFGVAMAALGYYSSGGIDYAVYGFGLAHTNGTATGRIAENNTLSKNTHIGLGIYGGVMGGWVRGLKYGFHTKGETYSLYVDGNGYTNKPLTYLIQPTEEGQDKIASFMSTSLKPEVTVNGKVNLVSGRVFVPFERAFQQIIANVDDVIITASPQGRSNGIYIDNISKEGFWIYENNDGSSNVKISWIAITKIKGEENPSVPSDLTANDFDKKMDQVMFNENDSSKEAQSLWWDGTKIRWDKPASDKVKKDINPLARPMDLTKK